MSTNINAEDKDANNQDQHNPVEAGKKAIEAEKLNDAASSSPSDKEKESKKDAEQWRNEG